MSAWGTRASRAATVAAALLALPGVLYLAPALMGAEGAFLVLSGSMEPDISPGDIVFVRETNAPARVGDVLTFRVTPGSDALVTHRVIALEEREGMLFYRTKGDANEDVDPWRVDPSQVVGEHSFTIPKWGLLLNVIRSRAGYVAFILVPGIVIVGREFVNLYRELDARDRAKRQEQEDRISALLASLEHARETDPLDELFARLEREEMPDDLSPRLVAAGGATP